jgi:hypothetical protein
MSGALAPVPWESQALSYFPRDSPTRRQTHPALALPESPCMLRRALSITGVCILAAVASIDAAQYKVVIKRLDANLFQAQASKVIIETRRCNDWTADDDEEEAILNWEGSFGNNWILFTASGTRCDVAAIR